MSAQVEQQSGTESGKSSRSRWHRRGRRWPRPGAGLAGLALGLVAALAASEADAQGIYLDAGKSGVGAAAGVSSGDGFTALTLGAGYSYQAFVDFGGFINRYGFDFDPGNHVSAIGFMPYVNLHLLRQDEKLPVAVSLTGNVERLSFSVDVPYPYAPAIAVSGWNWFFGGSTFRRCVLNTAFGAVPQLTLGVEHASRTTESPYGAAYWYASGSHNSLLLRVDGNFTHADAGGRLWSLDPMLALDDRTVTFGLFVGGVFQ